MVTRSLLQGDNVYVHCMTGVSKGAVAAAVICAFVNKEPLEEAARRIDARRNTSLFDGALAHMAGIWASDLIREKFRPFVWGGAYVVSERMSPVVAVGHNCQWREAGAADDESQQGWHPSCRLHRSGRCVRLAPPTMSKATPREAAQTWPDARFCMVCWRRTIASQRVLLREAFPPTAFRRRRGESSDD